MSWSHIAIGRCAKHGTIQTGVRTSHNGISPAFPWQECFPGEFCFQCYFEADQRKEPAEAGSNATG